MKTRANEYYGKAKNSASHKITLLNTQIGDVKDRLFNMDLPQHAETILRNRIRLISISAGFAALIALFAMVQAPTYLITSLLVGLIAMILDFFVEYRGISKRAWDYPSQHLSFRRVPVEIPLLFFSCGVLATFAFYCFSAQLMVAAISVPAIVGLSLIQLALLLVGSFFLLQYFIGGDKSLVFGALPISIALYLSFQEPWMLVAPLVPMYIDYYLEKRLVRSAHIKYDRYGEEVASNVAISYFPMTLFILGIIAALLYLLA